ncbi:MAG: hypothetical protein Q7S40_29680, partial [Opitutaceae bacterium]|nr:hypothetical protein [Opitutaceae bacterium]
LWIHPAMDTNDGMQVTVACLQPPDAENRTSGGVEGSRGAILATPSDLQDSSHLAGVAAEVTRLVSNDVPNVAPAS